MEDVTADFVYARLHGDEELYASGYSDEALDEWAKKFKRWRAGGEPQDAKRVCDRPAPKRAARDVYVYFDNDVKVRAPFEAAGLGKRLGIRGNAEPVPIVDLTNAGEAPRQSWPAIRRRRK